MLVERKDILRTMLLTSGIFLIFSVFYAAFLHAQYSGQINNIRLDLLTIKDWYNGKAEKATGLEAQEYKKIAKKAEDLAGRIRGPSFNPYAFTYLGYWISSAAFTDLILSYQELGLDNDTIASLDHLEKNNWFNNKSFYIYDLGAGTFVQKLASKPRLQAYFWSFYLAVILIVGIGLWLGIKGKYDVEVVPEIICGTLALIPFWIVFFLGALIALFLGFIRPENIPFGTYATSAVISLVLGSFSGVIVGLMRKRRGME